jgi:hypothetical protein
MSNCCDYPRVPMMRVGLGPGRDRKLAASTSPSNPNRHTALAAHQSANRNTVENNMRINYNRTTGETKTLGKKTENP